MSAPAQRVQIWIVSGPKRQIRSGVPIAIDFNSGQLPDEPGAQDLVSVVGRVRAGSVLLRHNHRNVANDPIDRTIRQRAITRCRPDCPLRFRQFQCAPWVPLLSIDRGKETISDT